MELGNYKKVQGIAKLVLYQLADTITPASTEASIVRTATNLLSKHGVKETWYYDVPAFILLGSRSCLSISGKEYTPSDSEEVGASNVVTVDLSPCIGDYWGDCARSFCVENGRHVDTPSNPEFTRGLKVEEQLHEKMLEFVTPDTTFSELFEFGNGLIREYGYENLDFLSNLGHSIEVNPKDRRYIDTQCFEKLGSVNLFTFEPHIRAVGKQWGFKHENIYYFDGEGKACEL